jgi:hypothetical protein
MISDLMLYGTKVALLVGLAALALERVAAWRPPATTRAVGGRAGALGGTARTGGAHAKASDATPSGCDQRIACLSHSAATRREPAISRARHSSVCRKQVVAEPA